MKRALILLFVMLCSTADAHVGSPDVFFEGEAGPYRLFVTVRTPQVIPGIAAIEIRSEDADVTGIAVVPMRLTGPGSDLPPASDRADRSSIDPKFFTTNVWLMEHGSMQIRIVVTGARGDATLSVPVPAYAQRTLTMPTGLGTLLVGLMTLLALAIVAILIGALREAALEPGAAPRSRGRIALVIVSAVVLGLLALGNVWWNAVAEDYAEMVMKPWIVKPTVAGCQLTIPVNMTRLLPDHGHEMHLFLVRMPEMDRLAHLHPTHEGAAFVQTLPSLPAGHYQLFADIVVATGFPLTGTATLDLPDLTCAPVIDDDTVWTAGSTLAGGARMIWDHSQLRAGVAQPLTFRVVEANGSPSVLEPYMGMAAHAEVIRSDATVFAHLHPNGSVAMPALELAQQGAPMAMAMPMPAISATLAFPFAFPRPGDYRIFVQIKRAGVIETASFDARVE